MTRLTLDTLVQGFSTFSRPRVNFELASGLAERKVIKWGKLVETLRKTC